MIVEGYTPKEKKKVRGELVSDKYNNIKVIETEDHERVVIVNHVYKDIVNHVYKDFEGNVFLNIEIAEEFKRRKKELGFTNGDAAKTADITYSQASQTWSAEKTKQEAVNEQRKNREKIWYAMQPLFKERKALLEYYDENFPQRLKEVRVKSGLSYEDVAKEVVADPLTIYRWENGSYKPSVRKQLALIDWCNDKEE